jgi:hypothetical protein
MAQRGVSATNSEAAAAAEVADTTTAAATHMAAAASTTTATVANEMDQAGSALQVETRGRISGQLRRRQHGHAARKSGYCHWVPHRKFPFVDLRAARTAGR